MATQIAVSRGRFDLNCPSANGELLSREVTQPPLQGPAMMGEELVQGPLGILPRVDKKSIGTTTVLAIRAQLLF